MYQPTRPSSSATIPVRHMHYHVHTWGTPQPGTAPLVLAHGWMDVGASYQFVVDAFSAAFAQERFIIAPDWRGFGRSMPIAPCDSYSFNDYVGDLDALLDHFAPGDTPIDLVGHSMGGNVAMMYAGARPQRIRRLVNLEGFGLPATQPTQAPQRLNLWLDELRQLHTGQMQLKTYDSVQGVAERLCKTNRRLDPAKALWLAHQWAAPDAQGRWAILGDTAHKVTNPQLFRVEEMLALYAAITAPVLVVEAAEDSLGSWWTQNYSLAEFHERLKFVPNVQVERVSDAGHMVHHDQPRAVAQWIESFCSA